MTEYLMKISGVHYAANPDSVSGQDDTEEMHVRTREMLSWIDRERPMVVLVAEPTNHFNPKAIMARALGRYIGRVGDDYLDVANGLLLHSGHPMILARIKKVVVRNHGYVVVAVDADESTRLQPLSLPEIEWRMGMSDLPQLPPGEQMQAEQEAAFILDTVLLPNLDATGVAELKAYLDIWMAGSRHDLSREARQARKVYIERMEASQNEEIRRLAEPLKEQQTSICGRTALNERTARWWIEWLESDEVNQMWLQWRLHIGNKLWNGLRQIDRRLQELPGELYNDIGKLDVFLARLYYMNTPRQALQAILALLMLRELTCRELGIGMHPMTEEDYQRDGFITNPMDMPTTIGRVVEFGKTQCELPIQRQTIQVLAQWLRDDYEQTHSMEIESLAEDRRNKLTKALEKSIERPQVCFNMEIVQSKETNIDKNYGPNIDNHDGGTISLPEKIIDNKGN